MFAPEIFKAYDIRGRVPSTLNPQVVRHIGHAIGHVGYAQGVRSIVVGRDGRLSGPSLATALMEGLRDAGLTVIDLGMVTTPMVYFAAIELAQGSGIAVTGSHNPPDYNGLKMMLGGKTLYGDAITQLHPLAEQSAQGKLERTTSRGMLTQADIYDRYAAKVQRTVRLARPIKVALDSGNGVAGAYASKVLKLIGAHVTEDLFSEVDGHFPNHHPDPADAHNLEDLINVVKRGEAEIGLAFDGDGDRLGVITKQGNIIWPDRQLILFAKDVLSQHPGATILFDVKCSRHVPAAIKAAGGQPLMWRTGHSLIKAKMREINSPFGGEMSGHIFFNDRWPGFDDGTYAAARLLEILSRSDDPSAVLDALPNAISTPELKTEFAEGAHYSFVEKLQAQAQFATATDRSTIDGLRVEYADGFGLVRPSNTTPVSVWRFEADTQEALARIQAEFAAAARLVEPSIKLPF